MIQLLLTDLLEPLSQLSTSANATIKQDATVTAARVVCVANHELLKQYVSTSKLANFVTRLINSEGTVSNNQI
jgi:hypothetical protein